MLCWRALACRQTLQWVFVLRSKRFFSSFAQRNTWSSAIPPRNPSSCSISYAFDGWTAPWYSPNPRSLPRASSSFSSCLRKVLQQKRTRRSSFVPIRVICLRRNVNLFWSNSKRRKLACKKAPWQLFDTLLTPFSLVCSDLISRGLDITHVAHVVSYDVPIDIRKYVHRVGRTARAGRRGEAWTLVEEQEAGSLTLTRWWSADKFNIGQAFQNHDERRWSLRSDPEIADIG